MRGPPLLMPNEFLMKLAPSTKFSIGLEGCQKTISFIELFVGSSQTFRGEDHYEESKHGNHFRIYEVNKNATSVL